MTDISLQRIGKLVNAPGFIEPWLDRFYEPAEIRILETFEKGFRDSDRFRKEMELSRDAMQRLFSRGVLAEGNKGRLTPANFHTRYDFWALFEGFKDIPDKIRDELNQWELDHYIQSHKKEVEIIRQTHQLDPLKVLPRYLLLQEALDVLDDVSHVFLWPCNCRSMIKACKKSVYTCLRFDNSQGQGYEISREKAKEIVLLSNRKGLMQSGELGRDKEGKIAGAICNCCPDCCFPHLLAHQLNAEKIWPKSRYIAQWQKDHCSFCGVCAKRCPFQAFLYDKKDEQIPAGLTFFKDLCRGCGLCAVTCPTNAIEMKEL